MNAHPVLTVLQATGAAIALLVLAAPVQADTAPPGTVFCTDSRAANIAFNPSFVACSAHYDNMPAPKPPLYPQPSLLNPFAGYGDFYFIGQTKNDDTGSGPFQPFGPGLTVGTLVLDTPQTGQFVIALASFDDYSLYLYDASAIAGGVTSIAFSTRGTTNELFGPYQLEYANLYAPIPEPTSAALMLAGLAATGLALRRARPDPRPPASFRPRRVRGFAVLGASA